MPQTDRQKAARPGYSGYKNRKQHLRRQVAAGKLTPAEREHLQAQAFAAYQAGQPMPPLPKKPAAPKPKPKPNPKPKPDPEPAVQPPPEPAQMTAARQAAAALRASRRWRNPDFQRRLAAKRREQAAR